VLCARCARSLRRLGPSLCSRCGAPVLWPVDRCRECSGRRLAFASARAAVAYAGPARHLVSAWKEHGLRRAGAFAADLVVTAVERPAADVITYIPADPDRLLRRGHHPAARLARELGDRWAVDVVPLLVRRGGLARQAELPRAERLSNLRDAFLAVASVPPRVLLVDDVYTTGATAAAGASALRRAGVRRVDVVTFARTVRW
jgi:predicted amidophosphoribosyltransferase